jgi:hypothetical protein
MTVTLFSRQQFNTQTWCLHMIRRSYGLSRKSIVWYVIFDKRNTFSYPFWLYTRRQHWLKCYRFLEGEISWKLFVLLRVHEPAKLNLTEIMARSSNMCFFISQHEPWLYRRWEIQTSTSTLASSCWFKCALFMWSSRLLLLPYPISSSSHCFCKGVHSPPLALSVLSCRAVITQWVYRWATGWTIGFLKIRFSAGAGNFSLHHCVQNCSGAHPTSYPVGTRGSFPGCKRPGREADRSFPCNTEVKEWVDLYLYSSSAPPWRAAQLKNRDNFTFLLFKHPKPVGHWGTGHRGIKWDKDTRVSTGLGPAYFVAHVDLCISMFTCSLLSHPVNVFLYL